MMRETSTYTQTFQRVSPVRRNDWGPQADPIVTGSTTLGADATCYRADGLPAWTLIYTIRGRAWFCTPEDKRFSSESGDVVLMHPRIRHWYFTGPAGPKWTQLWMVFDPPALWQPWLAHWPQQGEGHWHLRLAQAEPALRREVVGHLQSTHRLATGGGRHRSALAMNALEAALLWADAANPCSATENLDPRVERVVDFVRRNLAARIGLPELAEAAGLSIPHVSRLFREAFKVGPAAFVEQERMARARQLLDNTTLSIHVIARNLGFASPFYFATRFRGHTGLSPRAYRRRTP